MAEVKEVVYLKSIKSTAKDIIGPYLERGFHNYPHVKEDLSTLGLLIETESGNALDDLTFSHNVVQQFQERIKAEGRVEQPSTIPSIIAQAINTNDGSIQGLSDSRLRVLLDTSMDIPVDHYSSLCRNAIRAVSYLHDEPDRRKTFLDAASEHKSRVKHWQLLQDLLRETVSTPGRERK